MITLWSKERVGNITLQLQTCRDFIGWTYRQVEIRSCSIMEKQVLALIKRRFTQLSVQEEELWKQGAHFKWKCSGDRNNYFFHAYATGRKLIDHIHSLLEHGVEVLSQKDKGEAFFRHFCARLQTSTLQHSAGLVMPLSRTDLYA